ncbi:MAG: efflux RND transporter periplasmic adaptor subunit [Nitrospirae bacterium]|nr:efflux RND transporter periplasmic adaptor subunit [Nitrospirota bacterium]
MKDKMQDQKQRFTENDPVEDDFTETLNVGRILEKTHGGREGAAVDSLHKDSHSDGYQDLIDLDETISCPIDNAELDDIPNLVVNPIYLKLYKDGSFQKVYPLYILSKIKAGRSKNNEMCLEGPEISRNLFEINYTKEGAIMFTYLGRTLVNLSGRDLPPGLGCTEETVLGSEITFSNFKLVFSDNDSSSAAAVKYFKTARTGKKRLSENFNDEKDIDEEEILKLWHIKKWRFNGIIGEAHATKKILLGAAVLSFILIVALATWIFSRSSTKPSHPYSTAPVIKMNFVETLSFPGIINFLNPVPVVNPLAGRILSVGFSDGDTVTAGQVLFKIDNSNAFLQFQQARSDYVTAEANLRKYEQLETSVEYNEISKGMLESKNNLDRTAQRKSKTERLVGKGILSRVELERATVDYESALSQHQNFQNKLKQARTNFVTSQKLANLAVQKAKKALEEAEKTYKAGQLKSPLTGIVNVPVTSSGKVVYAVGQMINSDTVVVYIGDFENIGIKIEVPESQVKQLKESQMVIITTEMLKGKQIRGVIQEIAKVATIKDNSSVFDAKIRIILDDELRGSIKYGVSASASVIISEKPMALAVPVNAVLDFEGRPALLYIDKDRKVKMAFVNPGLTNEGYIELQDSKIPEGTNVVISGIEDILSSLDKKKLSIDAAKLAAPAESKSGNPAGKL